MALRLALDYNAQSFLHAQHDDRNISAECCTALSVRSPGYYVRLTEPNVQQCKI